MYNPTITVSPATHEHDLYANLGSGDLAEAVVMWLEAYYGGHYIKLASGDVIFYNGACCGLDDYQYLVDVSLA